jgi:NAD(P)-dependent dehydrogenase (short-subunit alcohol dehydrogenase family)
MSNLHIFGSDNLIAEAIANHSICQNIIFYSRGEPFFLNTIDLKKKKFTFVRCDYSSKWTNDFNFKDSLEGENTFIFLQSPFTNKLLIRTSDNEIDQDFDTGLIFNLKVTKRILSAKPNACNFIFFSSVLATRGSAGSIVYGTLKSGLEGFSRNIAAEYGSLGVRSNVVKLGYLDSGYALKLKQEIRESYKKNNFLKSSVDLSSIVYSVNFLIKAKSVTGSILNIDCGL